MAQFNRFDICEAYSRLNHDWRISRAPCRDIDFRLERMAFKPRPSLDSSNLSDNAREIYALACERLHLGHGGYHDCAVKDCFEIAIGWGAPVCNECAENGCGESGRCDCPHEDDGES